MPWVTWKLNVDFFFLVCMGVLSSHPRCMLEWIINRIHTIGTQPIKRNTDCILQIFPWCQTVCGVGE